jgi:hypothetical protein
VELGVVHDASECGGLLGKYVKWKHLPGWFHYFQI